MEIPSHEEQTSEIFRRLPTLEDYVAFAQRNITHRNPYSNWDFIMHYCESPEDFQADDFCGECNKAATFAAAWARLHGGIVHRVSLQRLAEPGTATRLGTGGAYEAKDIEPSVPLPPRSKPAHPPTIDPPEELQWHTLAVCRVREREYIVFSNNSVTRVCGDFSAYLRASYPKFDLYSRGGCIRWKEVKNRALTQWLQHIWESEVKIEDMEIAPLPRLGEEARGPLA